MFWNPVFFLLACLAFYSGISMSIGTYALLDMASLLIVAGGTAILLFMSFSAREIAGGIGFVFTGENELPGARIIRLHELYRTTGDYFIYTGLLGMLIGFVLIISSFSSWESFGPKIAVSMITVLYGAIGHLTCRMLRRKLESCRITGTESSSLRQRPGWTVLVSTVLFFLILLLSIIQSGEISALAGLAPALTVLGGSVAGCLLFCSPERLSRGLRTALSGGETSEDDAIVGLKSLGRCSDTVMSLAVLAGIAGMIGMISVWPEITNLGPGAVLCWLSLLYALVLLCLIRGLESRLRLRINAKREEAPEYWSSGKVLNYGLLVSAILWTAIITTRYTV